MVRAIGEQFGEFRIAPNFQVHVLSSLFFRHKTAFIIGRVLNGDRSLLVIPIVHGPSGGLALDAVLLDKEQVLILFSFSHSYFLVDGDPVGLRHLSCVT